MPWLTLLPVAGLCLLGAWLTFGTESTKGHALYVPAFVALGAATAAFYGCAVRNCDADLSFRYCVAYDAVVLVAYYVFPLLAGCVRPDWRSLLAAVLVAAAAGLLKGQP